MQGILNFDRNDPEEEKAFQRAIKAEEAHDVLWDISQEIFRSIRKYGGVSDPRLNQLLEGEHHEAILDVLEYLEGKFYEILAEHQINIG